MSEFNAGEFQYRKFERGAAYHHKIIKVGDREKICTKAGRKYKVWDIFSQDIKGEKFASEYLSPSDNPKSTQNVFFEGITQWFRCSQPGTISDEVEPCDEPPLTPNDRYFAPDSNGNVLPKNTTIMGTKASISMGFAKDLIVAKISSTGIAIDESIKAELFDLAEEIYNWFNGKEHQL